MQKGKSGAKAKAKAKPAKGSSAAELVAFVEQLQAMDVSEPEIARLVAQRTKRDGGRVSPGVASAPGGDSGGADRAGGDPVPSGAARSDSERGSGGGGSRPKDPHETDGYDADKDRTLYTRTISVNAENRWRWAVRHYDGYDPRLVVQREFLGRDGKWKRAFQDTLRNVPITFGMDLAKFWAEAEKALGGGT